MPEPAPKITLKFGAKASPADSPAPQSNGSNENDAPVNGNTRKHPFSASSAVPIPLLDQLERAKSMSDSAASPTPSNAAINEEASRNSPALNVGPGYSYRGSCQTVSTPGLNENVMLPPSTPALPHPNQSSHGEFGQISNHAAQYHPPTPTYESKWRQPGKGKRICGIYHALVANCPRCCRRHDHQSEHLNTSWP
jgi:hypothetical protein